MIYDKTEIKQFLLNYNKSAENSLTFVDDDINDFFDINEDTDFSVEDNENIEDTTRFNEIVTILEPQLTDKEYNLFLLLSNGVSFEKAGSIFGVKESRVRQMFNQLLDKILH